MADELDDLDDAPYWLRGDRCETCRLSSEILSKEKDMLYCLWHGRHVEKGASCEDHKNWFLKNGRMEYNRPS